MVLSPPEVLEVLRKGLPSVAQVLEEARGPLLLLIFGLFGPETSPKRREKVLNRWISGENHLKPAKNP